MEHTKRAQAELRQKKKMRLSVQIPTLHEFTLVNQRNTASGLQQTDNLLDFRDSFYNPGPSLKQWNFGYVAEVSLSSSLNVNIKTVPQGRFAG